MRGLSPYDGKHDLLEEYAMIFLLDNVLLQGLLFMLSSSLPLLVLLLSLGQCKYHFFSFASWHLQKETLIIGIVTMKFFCTNSVVQCKSKLSEIS